MPTYIYRAINKTGTLITNKVEEGSEAALYKKLKSNGLTPISIRQTLTLRKQTVKKKKNTDNMQELMRTINTTELGEGRRSMSSMDRIRSYFAMQQKITERDIVIFTQNFYLLKKANFNNVHALSTIIDSTENMAFVGILEDILAGVEARRLYV